jgi:DNA-binding XRE family transcriptional regulator
MPRPRKGEPTALGVAVRRKRGVRSLQVLAEELELTYSTLSNIERGAHAPSMATARVLAKWLGWTVGQVFDAAETPAPTDVVPSDP